MRNDASATCFPLRPPKRLAKVALALAVVVLTVCACLAVAACGLGGSGAGGGASREIPVRDAVEDYSWDELADLALQLSSAYGDGGSGGRQAMLAIAERYHLCDADGKLDGSQSKQVTRNDGSVVTFRIIGLCHDDKQRGGKAGITFMAAGPVRLAAMNTTDTNAVGWEDCTLRSWVVDSFVQTLPEDLVARMVPVLKPTNNLGRTTLASCVSQTTDFAFVLSAVEVYGSSVATDGAEDAILMQEGSQYQLFSDEGVRAGSPSVLLSSGYMQSVTWWLRSPDSLDARSWHTLDAMGEVGSQAASMSCGVVPAFCL